MRRFAVGVLASFLTSFLLLTAVSSALTSTFTTNNLKGWLSKHDVYQTVIDNFVKENKDLSLGNGNAQVSVAQPEVQTILKQAFTPGLLQKITEQFLDGTDAWLTGKVDKPNFQIDLASTKNDLADRLGAFAQNRYDSLPLCPRGQLPNTSDPLSIDCRVAGYSVAPQVASFINEIKTSQEFLPNTTLTADNLKLTNKDGADPNPFDELRNVPKGYQWAHRAPWTFGLLSALVIAAIVLLGADKRRAVRRVAITLLVASLLLLLAGWIISRGFSKANQEVLKKHNSDAVAIQKTALPVLKDMESSIVARLVVFGVVYLVAAGGGFTYLYMTSPKRGKPGPSDKPQPAGKTSSAA